MQTAAQRARRMMRFIGSFQDSSDQYDIELSILRKSNYAQPVEPSLHKKQLEKKREKMYYFASPSGIAPEGTVNMSIILKELIEPADNRM